MASVTINSSDSEAADGADESSPSQMKRRLGGTTKASRYLAQLETADRRRDAVQERRVVGLEGQNQEAEEEITRLDAIDAEDNDEREDRRSR